MDILSYLNVLVATNSCTDSKLYKNDHEVAQVSVYFSHIQHSSCVPIMINESALSYSKDANHYKQQTKNGCYDTIRIMIEHFVPIKMPLQPTLQNNNGTCKCEHSNQRSRTNMHKLFPLPNMSKVATSPDLNKSKYRPR